MPVIQVLQKWKQGDRLESEPAWATYRVRSTQDGG